MSPPSGTAADLAVTRAGGVTRVALRGELDVEVVPRLQDDALLLTGDAPAVVLDLAAVTFLDSAGVRLLDHLVAAHEQRGAPVLLVAPRGSRVRRVLDLCGFRESLLASTAGEAETALSGAPGARPASQAPPGGAH